MHRADVLNRTRFRPRRYMSGTRSNTEHVTDLRCYAGVQMHHALNNDAFTGFIRYHNEHIIDIRHSSQRCVSDAGVLECVTIAFTLSNHHVYTRRYGVHEKNVFTI